MPALVVGALDEDQADLSSRRCAVEFSFDGGGAIRVFAVIISKETHVNAAAVDFAQVDIISPSIGDRQVFEQKHIEEATQQRIPMNVILDGTALRLELLLDAADKHVYLHAGSLAESTRCRLSMLMWVQNTASRHWRSPVNRHSILAAFVLKG
jgi:hypothetical protein